MIFILEKCIVPLGLESGEIPDEGLTQSTNTALVISRSADVRLNKPITVFPNGWQGSISAEDWVQIDFGSLRKITGIATQGGYNMPYFVTKYTLSYSNSSIEWTKYTVDGVEKVNFYIISPFHLYFFLPVSLFFSQIILCNNRITV